MFLNSSQATLPTAATCLHCTCIRMACCQPICALCFCWSGRRRWPKPWHSKSVLQVVPAKRGAKAAALLRGGGGHHHHHHGPPDDLDLEMEALLVRARATAAAQAAARGLDPSAVEPVVPPRPEFPPPYLLLQVGRLLPVDAPPVAAGEWC